MEFSNTQEFAQQMDAADPLRSFRDQFHIPRHGGKDCVYFTGNSLGLQPKRTMDFMRQELDDWATLGVEGHLLAKRPWFSYHENFPALLSGIIGALPEEIVVMNQLTVNLHILLTTFYRPQGKRNRIICEARAFPSDQYALESQVMLHGLDPREVIIEVSPRKGEYNIRNEDILNTIRETGDQLALVLFGGVNYYNGQVFDMRNITRAAHEVGALAGYDLAHAAGNIPLQMHDWDADFACWCSYKYLNSGPGGVAGVFIHRKHAVDTSLPRLAGWWGYEKESRFQMKPGFRPIPTAEGWQLSNAPVLSMAAHLAALEIFGEARMERLVEKSGLLSGFLFHILHSINEEHGHAIEVITPRQRGEHGCQVSMLVNHQGRRIFEALIARGVIADWREPNVIRVAPVPLYNTFEDVWRFGDIIRSILKQSAESITV